MEFQEFIKKANEIKHLYESLNKAKGQKRWSVAEYMQGFVGDTGNLMKLIMAKNNLRTHTYKDVDRKITHELVDCLWSILVIAEELGVDLENEYFKNLEAVKKKRLQ